MDQSVRNNRQMKTTSGAIERRMTGCLAYLNRSTLLEVTAVEWPPFLSHAWISDSFQYLLLVDVPVWIQPLVALANIRENKWYLSRPEAATSHRFFLVLSPIKATIALSIPHWQSLLFCRYDALYGKPARPFARLFLPCKSSEDISWRLSSRSWQRGICNRHILQVY